MSGSILTAIDFSDITDDVLAHAAKLAESLDAELVILHAAAPEPDFVGYDAGPQHVRDNRAHTLRDEHKQLEAIGATLRERGITTHVRLHTGPTVETILAEASERAAAFIVVGAHRRSRAAKLLLGSVSEGVLRKAVCPVVVVPPPA